MANTRSAEKQMRQSEKRRLRNAGIRSGVRTAVKSVRSAIESGSVDEARVQWSRTLKALDKAATVCYQQRRPVTEIVPPAPGKKGGPGSWAVRRPTRRKDPRTHLGKRTARIQADRGPGRGPHRYAG